MALKTKGKKRKTKRVRLGEAVRAALDPVMAAYGYRHPPNAIAREMGAYPSYTWVRVRQGHVDVLELQFNKYDHALFVMNWRTSEAERMGGLIYSNLLFNGLTAWTFTVGDRSYSAEWFGWWSSISRSVLLAVRRAEELEAYLHHRGPDIHVGVRRWMGSKEAAEAWMRQQSEGRAHTSVYFDEIDAWARSGSNTTAQPSQT